MEVSLSLVVWSYVYSSGNFVNDNYSSRFIRFTIVVSDKKFFSLNDLGIWCRSVRPTLRIPIPRSRVHSVHLGPQHVSFIRRKVFHYDNSLLFSHHHCCPYLSRSHQHMRYLDTHCLKARVIQLQGFLSFANVEQLHDVISLSMLKRKDTSAMYSISKMLFHANSCNKW